MNNLFDIAMKVITTFVITFILLFASNHILDTIKASDAKYQTVLECMASGKSHHECHGDTP